MGRCEERMVSYKSEIVTPEIVRGCNGGAEPKGKRINENTSFIQIS